MPVSETSMGFNSFRRYPMSTGLHAPARSH